MNVEIRLSACGDFWREILVPDYREHRVKQDDLRRALHAANSLFHMHDWVFTEHKDQVRRDFSLSIRRQRASAFGDALEGQCSDFALIRSIANAGKHLGLDQPRRVPDAANNAANTVVGTTGWGEGGYAKGPSGGGPRVILVGSEGKIFEFADIAKNVFDMWETLNHRYGWW